MQVQDGPMLGRCSAHLDGPKRVRVALHSVDVLGCGGGKLGQAGCRARLGDREIAQQACERQHVTQEERALSVALSAGGDGQPLHLGAASETHGRISECGVSARERAEAHREERVHAPSKICSRIDEQGGAREGVVEFPGRRGHAKGAMQEKGKGAGARVV